MIDHTRFADLERAAGQNYEPVEGDKWPLEEWYAKVRQIPITQMSVGDLATACRQDVWTAQVILVMIEVLKGDPYAGELYDGELVVALKLVPVEFWKQNPELAQAVKAVVEPAVPEFESQVQADAKELLSRLERQPRD